MTVPIRPIERPSNAAFVDAGPPVLFFDGECGLCNRSVRWLMKRDRRRVLRLAPLQGRLAAQKQIAVPVNYQDWALAFWDEDGVHYESDATLRALARLGGAWRLSRVLLFIPRVIRNGIYRWVARHRVRWFGRVEYCGLLSVEDRERLLP